MTKGIVLYAEGTEYVKQARLCALSIRRYNDIPICLITDQEDRDPVFDHVIKLQSSSNRFKTDNRCQIYDLTPYDETIVLDSDTLVLENIDHMWNILSQQEVFYTTSVYNYRGDIIIDKFYRKTFIQNKLPNVYNAFYYFKKCSKAQEFYSIQKQVNENWKEVYAEVCQFSTPTKPSMDVNAAIAALFTDTIFYKTTEPKLVHMKSRIQGWEYDVDTWQNKVGTYVTDNGDLFIGNNKQTGIFHYTENSFVTDNIIGKFANV